jgi:hypothetical protein
MEYVDSDTVTVASWRNGHGDHVIHLLRSSSHRWLVHEWQRRPERAYRGPAAEAAARHAFAQRVHEVTSRGEEVVTVGELVGALRRRLDDVTAQIGEARATMQRASSRLGDGRVFMDAFNAYMRARPRADALAMALGEIEAVVHAATLEVAP